MKLAIGGKGGSGKTAIAGTLARVIATRGLPVVALDDDQIARDNAPLVRLRHRAM